MRIPTRPLRSLAAAVACLAVSAPAGAEEPTAVAPDATELMREAHLNMYYAGEDGSAHVTMTITDKKGRTREREFVIVRRDWEDGGEQRYYVYFSRPNDVRRTTFMAWKDPNGDDARWIYVPALDLVKPISANDKKSSFVGSDFAYEDVSGRHWSSDDHTFLREEERDGRSLWVVESRPRDKDYFARKVTWIDAEQRMIVREEYFDSKERELKVFETLELAEVDGYPTAVRRKMSTPRKQNETVIEFRDIRYDVGVDEAIYSERFLKSPPREYVQ